MTGFREQGSGIPLMLLHGISSGAASWHKQMALNGFRVLAWDMPGYGESPMLAVARANAGDYADALAAMLDRAGVWQTVLVGHSLGALVASAFAAKFPDRVIHLVLADAAQGYGNAAPAQREQVSVALRVFLDRDRDKAERIARAWRAAVSSSSRPNRRLNSATKTMPMLTASPCRHR